MLTFFLHLKDRPLGCREMGVWIKCLQHKHEDLILDPHALMEKLNRAGYACKARTGVGTETGETLISQAC